MENDTIRLQNDLLGAEVALLGGELRSLKAAGTEFLWQADPAYWKGYAPNLFPYTGRFTGGHYTFGGNTYEMPAHGFLRGSVMQVESATASELVLALRDSAGTLAQWPFPFLLRLRYALVGNALHVAYEVHNTGDETMYFGLGGHPAINVPLEEGLGFEDYALRFAPGTQPTRVDFSDAGYVQGPLLPFALAPDGVWPLRHAAFDEHDSIFLHGTGGALELHSPKGRLGVKMNYPGFPYIGLWQMPHKASPFLCIEPWMTLPSRQDVVEDLATQPGLQSLKPGESRAYPWRMEVGPL